MEVLSRLGERLEGLRQLSVTDKYYTEPDEGIEQNLEREKEG